MYLTFDEDAERKGFFFLNKPIFKKDGVEWTKNIYSAFS